MRTRLSWMFARLAVAGLFFFSSIINGAAPPTADAPVVAAEVPQLFRFDDLYEVSLGICVVFLFLSLWWLTLLRRKVKEQAAELKDQFERETVLQKRFKDLFEHANDLVMTIDSAGFVTALNAAGEQVL